MIDGMCLNVQVTTRNKFYFRKELKYEGECNRKHTRNCTLYSKSNSYVKKTLGTTNIAACNRL